MRDGGLYGVSIPKLGGGVGGKVGGPLHPTAWGDKKGGLHWGEGGVHGVGTPKLGALGGSSLGLGFSIW